MLPQAGIKPGSKRRSCYGVLNRSATTAAAGRLYTTSYCVHIVLFTKRLYIGDWVYLHVSEVKVVHDVGHEDVLKEVNVLVVVAAEEGMSSIRSKNIFFDLSFALAKRRKSILL